MKHFFSSPVDIRLVDGSWSREGRVEILHNGEWRSVCGSNWDLNDANVVCRQLGFPGASSDSVLAHFGHGNGSIRLDNVNCRGHENSLEECSYSGWGTHNCGAFHDASVVCERKYIKS